MNEGLQRYDVASAIWQGKRAYQEDSLMSDFHGGDGRGFAVLADGMGGHAAGDLASRLVVIDAASHLKFLMHDADALESSLPDELKGAVETANGVLADRVKSDRRVAGMGATFLATVVFENRLYWASVGDSPLYLFRDGKLQQINEDHSMAPVFDQMAANGDMTAEQARTHPDRNALTSVLMGRPLEQMDIPKTPEVLRDGDVVIVASDGLQYLEDQTIEAEIAAAGSGASSAAICDRLLTALKTLDNPQQDNVAILVLQIDASGGAGDIGDGDRPAKTERLLPGANEADETDPEGEDLAETEAEDDDGGGMSPEGDSTEAEATEQISRVLRDDETGAKAAAAAAVAAAAPQPAAASEPKEKSGGMPGWAVPVGIAALLLIGLGVWVGSGGGREGPIVATEPATTAPSDGAAGSQSTAEPGAETDTPNAEGAAGDAYAPSTDTDPDAGTPETTDPAPETGEPEPEAALPDGGATPGTNVREVGQATAPSGDAAEAPDIASAPEVRDQDILTGELPAALTTMDATPTTQGAPSGIGSATELVDGQAVSEMSAPRSRPPQSADAGATQL